MELLSALLLFTAVFGWAETQHFTYDAQTADWSSQFGSCKGKHQSPIDIDILSVRNVKLPPLVFHNFNKIPRTAKIHNNGHTAHYTIESDATPTISGGPLTSPYRFEQLHYHWGNSETSINGLRFPMELHVVFYKQEYRNITNAMKKSDGLAVLSFFFEISKSPNSAYAEMSNLLPTISKVNTTAHFTKPLALQSFMVSNIHQYYVYNGSLTTPPCSEVVTWLDFYDPIKISLDQFHTFWELEDHKGQPISFNFRPTQPIGDRIVWYTKQRFSENEKNLYNGVFGNKINPAEDHETERLIFSRVDTADD